MQEPYFENKNKTETDKKTTTTTITNSFKKKLSPQNK
jgi:hypothetical protein